MSPEQIRLTIAEMCGWRKVYNGPEPDNRYVYNGRYYTDKDIPDYTNDLNAIHEVEMSLSPEMHNKFKQKLCYIAGMRDAPRYSTPGWRNRYASATAMMRAEAILRAADKWTGSPFYSD